MERLLSQEEEKCSEIARGQFTKSTETARLLSWKFITTDKRQYGSFITLH